MIIKPHQVPLALLQYETLNRRISQNHPRKEMIQRQAKILRVGYQGETSLDFTLQFLDDNEFYILHNLRLQDKNGFSKLTRSL